MRHRHDSRECRTGQAKEGRIMDVSMQGGRITLAREGLLALRDACGAKVECVRGSIWVTQESDGIDHVLFPGQAVTIDHQGLRIVTALDAAVVAVSAKRRVEATLARPGRRTAVHRVASWLRGFLPGRSVSRGGCPPARRHSPWLPALSGR
jgi:hypothetical protein